MFAKTRVNAILFIVNIFLLTLILGLTVYVQSREKVVVRPTSYGKVSSKVEAANNSETNSTILIFQTKYRDCGHIISYTENVNKTFENKEAAQQAYEKDCYEVKSFEKGRVVFYREVSGICPQHYIVKESNGVVVVYFKQQQPDGQHIIKEITDIPVKILGIEDQERLRNGIQVYSDDELYKILEEFGS